MIPTEDLFKATVLAMELGMMEPTNQILGGHALFDLEDLGLNHAWQTTPAVASKIVKMLGVSILTHCNNIFYFSLLRNPRSKSFAFLVGTL